MADKIVQIITINQNNEEEELIPQKVQEANYILYTAENPEAGTIEDRLLELGY